jgi:hypothetical protein
MSRKQLRVAVVSNETPETPIQNEMSAWLDLDGRSWFELLGPMFLAIFLIILVAGGAISLDCSMLHQSVLKSALLPEPRWSWWAC